MTKFQDFKYPNVRKLFRGHLIGAFIGAVVAYWAFTIYNTNPTFAAFAVTPLEKVLDFDFEEVDNLEDTERGEGGFGSTGNR